MLLLTNLIKCTIQNRTKYVLNIKQTFPAESDLGVIGAGSKFDLDIPQCSSYREYDIWGHREVNGSVPRCVFTLANAIDWMEISIYTRDDFEDWLGTLRRQRISEKERDDRKVVKNETSASLKRILSRTNKLKLHLKNIKICPAQSKHLVQTFSEGIRDMAENYTKVFEVEDSIHRLYFSGKLRILENIVDSLEKCVRDTDEFLLECTREWKHLALQVSLPLRSSATTTRSKFDLLIGELRWNLDKIGYILCLGEELSRVKWKWCPIRYRHVLESGRCQHVDQEGPDIGDSSLVNRTSDRDNLRHHLEDGSTFAHDYCLTICRHYTCFAQIGSGEAFREILKKRLCTERCTSPTTTSSSIPMEVFRINHLDVKDYSDLLCRGSSKTVHRGQWFGQEVAIAIMVHIESLESVVEREARFLVELQHPNIVAFYGYSYARNALLPASKNPTEAGYLVMELMEGDLFQVLKSRGRTKGPFSVSVALDIMLQIVEAMVYLHERNIMHRDLKPANCLVKSRPAPPDVYYTVKLTDFGSAREVETESPSDLFTVRPGTTRWMAPEMLGTKDSSERVKYTKSGDVYGFAIICYQVVTGVDLPMPEIKQSEVMEAVRNGARPSFPAYFSCPEGLKELIIDCWHEDPGSRPNFVDIRERLWTVRKDVELQA